MAWRREDAKPLHICAWSNLNGFIYVTYMPDWFDVWWQMVAYVMHNTAFLQQEGVLHMINPNFVGAEYIIMPTRITAHYHPPSLKNTLLFMDFGRKKSQPFSTEIADFEAH